MIDFTNFTMLGSWVLDIILILISASACFYCALLSRRLKALNALDDGVGASIVSLTDAIGKTHEAAREAQNTTHETVRTLEQLLEKCESMAPNIESLIAQLDNRIATGSKLKLHVNDELIPEIDNASTRARATAATLLKMLEVVDARSKMAARQAKVREKPVKTAPKRPKSENKSQGLVLPQVKLNTKSHTSASPSSRLSFVEGSSHDFNAKVA